MSSFEKMSVEDRREYAEYLDRVAAMDELADELAQDDPASEDDLHFEDFDCACADDCGEGDGYGYDAEYNEYFDTPEYPY